MNITKGYQPEPELEIAIASTGDPAEDQRQLERAHLSEQRRKEGRCPNGCKGNLTFAHDCGGWVCATCKFTGFGDYGPNSA